MHHTKDKGDLGVLKAQADLAAQGYMVLLPLTDHAAFDLVIYRGQKFRRVQVKYRALDGSGCVSVRLRSVWNDRHGTHTVAMDKSEVDLVGIYCPDTDKCYYFDPRNFNQAVKLRVRAARNNQRADVKQAADYRRVP